MILPRLRAKARELGANARPARIVVPDEPVEIDRLVSPLRYDVLVRQRYFDFLAANLDRYVRDFEGLFAEAMSLPYYRWFATVVVQRFFPGTSETDARAMFRDRIHQSTILYRSVTKRGLDPRQPIMLRSGGRQVRTSTGKVLVDRVFAGDGCHRLALVRSMGWRHLPAECCRIRIAHGWSPPDNTHTLIRALGITHVDYITFLSMGYADTIFTNQDELCEHVAANDPDRLKELRRILTIDRPALVAAT
ncbi:MAG: hypothetical protein ACRD29_21430 [Acidimicrobiales bacterium]